VNYNFSYNNQTKEILTCELDPNFDDKDLKNNNPPTQIKFAPAPDSYLVGRGTKA
jgi:hypothetical protein